MQTTFVSQPELLPQPGCMTLTVRDHPVRNSVQQPTRDNSSLFGVIMMTAAFGHNQFCPSTEDAGKFRVDVRGIKEGHDDIKLPFLTKALRLETMLSPMRPTFRTS